MKSIHLAGIICLLLALICYLTAAAYKWAGNLITLGLILEVAGWKAGEKTGKR
jgi:hypothetical protein